MTNQIIQIFFYMKNVDIPYNDYIFNTYSTNYINDRKYITDENNPHVNENVFEKLANIQSFRFSLFFDIFFELKVNFNHFFNSHICVQNGLKYLFFYMKNSHKFNLIIDCKQKMRRIAYMKLFSDNITNKEKKKIMTTKCVTTKCVITKCVIKVLYFSKKFSYILKKSGEYFLESKDLLREGIPFICIKNL
ncbi:hypothetical protein PFLG_01913 [Plasmodium falciparum RAJ116]|uniref:Uncharacterized protein n=1 Tax=Plasmodium falciparum RAJ116 TaxID=580058 RepID=A0A0L0D076_PLAFA|nr:hypothetical protein PFLG_01913 [Plasmodium falciparum RAJ116]